MMTTDTKAHWRRRALRAEAELETMRQIRSVDNSMEIKLAHENAALRVAFGEVEDIVADLNRMMEASK